MPDFAQLYWRPSPKPKGGRRGSPKQRQWPVAYWDPAFKRVAATLYCSDDYTFQRSVNGGHSPITVHVLDYGCRPPKRRTCTATAANYAEARTLAARLLGQHPEFAPQEDER